MTIPWEQLAAAVSDTNHRNKKTLSQHVRMSTYECQVEAVLTLRSLGWRIEPPDVCPDDTNGDGDCGKRMCPHCGSGWSE